VLRPEPASAGRCFVVLGVASRARTLPESVHADHSALGGRMLGVCAERGRLAPTLLRPA
jgi:hypothetical protein